MNSVTTKPQDACSVRGHSRFSSKTQDPFFISFFVLLSTFTFLLLFLLIGLPSFTTSSSATPDSIEWSGEIQITDADIYAGTPAAAIDAFDNTFVVWEEGAGYFNESREIHFMKMDPSGEVVINRTLASTITLDSGWPDIAVEDDGTSHIVWQDSNFLFKNIFYQVISPEGEPYFLNPIPLVQDSLGTYTPSIDVDHNGNAHVVWLDMRITEKGPDHEIYYTELDPTMGLGRAEEVTDEDIRLIDDTRISSDLMMIDIVGFFDFLTGYKVLEYPPFPDVAVNSEGHVNIIWTDARDGNPEIYYSKLDPSLSMLNGESSDLTTLSIVNNSRLTWNPSLSLQPMIAVGPDDTAHIAFTDNITDSFEVYYATIDDQGEEINSTLQRISGSDQEPSGLSPIVVDREGNAYISWRDMCCGHFEIFLSKIASNGDILWDNQRISHSDSTAGNPPAVVDSNLNPIIFWQDNRTSTSQIYYNRTSMFPDLSVSVNDITSNAMHGSDSLYEVTVKNEGNLNALTSMIVQIDGRIWEQQLDLEAGEQRTYAFSWPATYGKRESSVSIDPNNGLMESNEMNNHVTMDFHVPYPPMVGLSKAEVIFGKETFATEANSIQSLSISERICWLNLSIYNSGGSPSGPIKILVSGMPESGSMDPTSYSTTIDLNTSSDEVISFIIDPSPGLWDYQIDIDCMNALEDSWKEESHLNFSVEFLDSPDPSVQDLSLSGPWTEGKDHRINVALLNTGPTPAAGTLDVFVDGELFESRFISLLPNEEQNQTFSWEPRSGGHEISAVLDVIPDRNDENNSASIRVTIDPDDTSNKIPLIIAAVAVSGLVAALLIFTEAGRFEFLKFAIVPLIPLYTRIKRGKVLDHFIRGQVYGFIQANPGAHYNLIRRKLEINNGALAYHIAVLEREKFIRSRMDGTLKRFYPSDMNLPSGHELTEMELKLLNVIRANPGFSQKEIALTLGLSPQVVNYHIKSLARNHILRLTRIGKRTLCYVNEDMELDS